MNAGYPPLTCEIEFTQTSWGAYEPTGHFTGRCLTSLFVSNGLACFFWHTEHEEPSSCDILLLRGRKEKKVLCFVLKGHNSKINIKLWEKSKKKKKVKCLVTASAMCYLVCFGRADSWCLIPLERAGCFSGSQSSCSANLMKSHSGFTHHLVLFVFSSNSARKRTKGFSTDSLGRCQWSTSRSLGCIYWPHRSPLVPFQLPPVISHFNTALHTGCT